MPLGRPKKIDWKTAPSLRADATHPVARGTVEAVYAEDWFAKLLAKVKR